MYMYGLENNLETSLYMVISEVKTKQNKQTKKKKKKKQFQL